MDDEEDQMWSKVFQVVEWSSSHNIQFEGCQQDLVTKAKETVDNYVGLRLENKKLKEELGYLKAKLAGERRRSASAVGVGGPATKRKSCQGGSPPQRMVSTGSLPPESVSENGEDNNGGRQCRNKWEKDNPNYMENVNEEVGEGVVVTSEGGDHADVRGSSVEATAGSETEIQVKDGEPITLKRRLLQAFADDVALQKEITESPVLPLTCHDDDDDMPILSPEYILPDAAAVDQFGEELHDETLVQDHADGIDLDLQSVSVGEEVDNESIWDQAASFRQRDEDDAILDKKDYLGVTVAAGVESGESDEVKDDEILTVRTAPPLSPEANAFGLVQLHNEEWVATQMANIRARIAEEQKKRVIKGRGKPNRVLKDWLCPVCDKKFTHLRKYDLHLRSHMTDPTLECPVAGCDKKSKTKSDLNKHKETHEEHRVNFQCRDCRRTFVSVEGVNRHMLNTDKGCSFRHWKKLDVHGRHMHYGGKKKEWSEDSSDLDEEPSEPLVRARRGPDRGYKHRPKQPGGGSRRTPRRYKDLYGKNSQACKDPSEFYKEGNDNEDRG